MRRALRAGPARVQTSQPKSFPAPIRGWIRNESLATAATGGAYVLDNWFPTATTIRARLGSGKYATIGAGTRVNAIMSYINGPNRKLFAGNDTAIYDITTIVDPNVSPSPAVSGLVASDFGYTLFSNSAGTFLFVVNAHDAPQAYNGTAWSVPAITGAAAPFSHVWTFKKRLFFVEKDTMNAWYLPVDAIAGAAAVFPLGGVFKLGGSLLFGATWSYDSGSGKAESCVFVTTEGEVAVYEGDDPSAANTFALKGVYRIGRPLGKLAVMKGGGDLAIASDIGLVPLSQAVIMDVAALGAKSVSYPIEVEWNNEVAQRRAQFSWQVEMWPTQQMAIVAMPSYASLSKICFVVNSRTGAWARYTGWDMQCLGLFIDRMFFGTSDGKIMEAEIGGSDDGQVYTALYAGLFDDFGTPAAMKEIVLGRATFLATGIVNGKVSASTDYIVNVPVAPDVGSNPSDGNKWDQGLWNQAMWSEAVQIRREGPWRSVPGIGFSISPVVQVSVGSAIPPQVDLVSTDLIFGSGAIVT